MGRRAIGVVAVLGAVIAAVWLLEDGAQDSGDVAPVVAPAADHAEADAPLVSAPERAAPVEAAASETASDDDIAAVTLWRSSRRATVRAGVWAFVGDGERRDVDVARDGATVALPAGTWRIDAPAGWSARPDEVDLAAGDHALVDVVAIAPLRVRVVDVGGAPVRGATVAWHGRETVWTTTRGSEHVVPDADTALRTSDADGRAGWPPSARGEGWVSASRDGVGFAARRLWPEDDAEVVLTLDDATAGQPLRVVSALDGAPVVGARLLRDGRPVSSISSDDGRLAAWLPAGAGAHFVLAAPAFVARTTYWIGPDVETLTLAPLARLHWTVTPDAAPQVAIRVVRDDGETDLDALLPRWTDDDATRGVFVVPRDAEVEIEAVAARRAVRRVTIDAPDVSVDLGQLTDAPFLTVVAPGARELRVLAPSVFRTRPAVDGRARVFASDAYQLRVRLADHEVHVYAERDATDRGGVLTLDLPAAARQTIRVVDEADRPVAGVHLRLQAPADGSAGSDHPAWRPQWFFAALPPTAADGRTSAALPLGRYSVQAWYSRDERIHADVWGFPIDGALTIGPTPGDHELRVGRSRRVTLDVRWRDGAPVARFEVVEHGEACCGAWTRWLSSGITELSVIADGALGETVAVPPGDEPVTIDVVLERGDVRATFTTSGLPDDVERLSVSFFAPSGMNTGQRAVLERESPGRYFAPDAVLLADRRVSLAAEAPDGSWWKSDLIDGHALPGALVVFEREEDD